MPASRTLTLLSIVIAIAIVVSGVLGTQAYQYLNNPLRLNEGAWEGKGAVYIDDSKIDSNAMMLVANDGIRLSISNRYNEFNYTYDVTLELKRVDHVSTDFEIKKREVRGLEAFIENTNIDIPLGSNLIRLNAWNLDEGRIFIEVEQSAGLDVSYILDKKSGS